MKEIKNVLICGIGAIGSIYAEKFNSIPFVDFRVLVDEDRYSRYTVSPVIFNGKELILNYVLPEETGFSADLIIISTKFDGLNNAIKNIKNFVRDDTIILSLLNGVSSEKMIAGEYGWDKILLSYFIGHSAIRNGRRVFHDDVNTIVFGAKNGFSPNVQKVKEFFDRAKINYQIPSDMLYSMWLKYMLNVSTNQPSAIFKMTFGQMQENIRFVNFAVNIMKEVQAVAKAEGVNNFDNLIDDALKAFYSMSPWGKTSMLQDVEAGRKTEVDIFAGTMIRLGEKHNIPTPYNSMIKEMIEVIHCEQGNKSAKMPVLELS